MEIQKRCADSSPLSIDNVVLAARKKFPAGPRPPGAAVALDPDAGARHIFGAFGVHWKIDGELSVLHSRARGTLTRVLLIGDHLRRRFARSASYVRNALLLSQSLPAFIGHNLDKIGDGTLL